jgi:competence protein ComEA
LPRNQLPPKEKIVMPRIFRSLALAVALLFTVMPAISHAAPPPATTPSGKIDINTATADQLKAFPGIGEAYSKRIIDGRPYANKGQLVSKGVLPQATYDKIKDQIIATQPKK